MITSENNISTSEKRVGTIDFFKFIFSILIVGFHTGTFYDTSEDAIWCGGFIAVEFFFIVSGYLLTAKAAKETCANPFEANLQMLRKKVLHFFPYVFIAAITSNIFYAISVRPEISTISNYLLLSIFDIFYLQMAGFVGFYATGVSWYLSSLLIVSFTIYPILCKKRKLFTYWIAPLLAIMLLGYIGKQGAGAGLSFPDQWYGIVYEGLLRGFADIAIGCMAYEFKCYLDATEVKNKFALLLLELSGYLAVCLYGIFHQAYTDLHDFLVLPLVFFSVAISFSNKSLLAHVFSGKIWGVLGAFSFSIYLNHVYVKDDLPHLFPDMGRRELLIAYILISFALALMNYCLGKQLSKYVRSISKIIALVLIMAIAALLILWGNSLFASI